jgi:hypothetical protein
MNIVGKGKKVIDADLLSRLAVNAQTGNTVSKAELQSAIKDVRADLKDQFSYSDSTRGLTRMKDAVANTLELAIKSGWVRSGSAQSVIKEFLEGSGKGSLEQLAKDIKAEVKANSGGSVGYGGSSSSVSYSGGGWSSSVGGGGSGSVGRYSGT